jgi:hypothetical protein
MQIPLGDLSFNLMPDDFRTGSFGWKLNQRSEIQVNGSRVPVMVNINITAIGSKEAV